jgi:hypothetical protein
LNDYFYSPYSAFRTPILLTMPNIKKMIFGQAEKKLGQDLDGDGRVGNAPKGRAPMQPTGAPGAPPAAAAAGRGGGGGPLGMVEKKLGMDINGDGRVGR